MNLLRAQVRTRGGWWEIKLIDLNIVADGDSEEAMLHDLEYALTAEYHLAIKSGRIPFVNLCTSVPTAVAEAWKDDHKKFRRLDLPTEVSMALSAVLHHQTAAPIAVEAPASAADDKYAQAA
jgi:hypothetical protein